VRGPLALAAVAFGAGWFTLRVFEAPRDSIVHRLPVEGVLPRSVPMTVDGVVLRGPRPVALRAGELDSLGPHARRARFPLRVLGVHEASGVAPASGRLMVFATGMQAEAVHAGQHVRVTGLARAEAPPSNAGQPDYRLWRRQTGGAGLLRVDDPSLVQPLPRVDSVATRVAAAYLGIRDDLRKRARDVLLGPKPDGASVGGGAEQRALLAALALGLTDEDGSSALRERFARLGIVHLIAISGFHLLVLTGASMFLLRLTGDHGRFEAIVTALVVLVYLLLVPSRPPVIRAGLMVLAMLGVEATGRRYDRLNTLAWIATIGLIAMPMDLWAMGFQLSYGLAAALLWAGDRVHARLFAPAGVVVPGRPRPSSPLRRLRSMFTGSLAASVLCWSLATPLVMYHVGLASPLAVLTTLITFPLIAVLLVGSYGALLLGVVAPPLVPFASEALGSLAGLVLSIVAFIDGLPGSSIRTPPVSVWWVAFATATGAYWLTRGRLRSAPGWALLGVSVGWFAAEAVLGPRLPARTPFRIDTLAVGDGSCHLLRSGGEAMLWDCGSRSKPIGARLVPDATRALGVGRIEEVVITHPDLDHFSGLPELIDRLGVRRAYVGRAFLQSRGDAVGMALEAMDSNGVEIVTVGAGDTLELGRVTLTFLSPPADASWPADNDHSLVARVDVPTSAGARTVLLTGDIERDAIRALLDSGRAFEADIMELPHHGSANESAYELVTRLDPSVVLQSTGPRRVGDVRWAPFAAGRAWFATARDGAAWAEVRRDGTIRAGAMQARSVSISP